jgi:aspartyl aminopeptidase
VNEALKFNQETEFAPILTQVAARLSPRATDSDSEDSSSDIVKIPANTSTTQSGHHSGLLSVIADELSVAPGDIHDFDLYGASLSFPYSRPR